jgi:hypothetical protein|tara:strand:+ start:2191 stop:2298 length:108 start_codon:yes stop_codon:yes gene_type:complete
MRYSQIIKLWVLYAPRRAALRAAVATLKGKTAIFT